jgi:hypothetical protein
LIVTANAPDGPAPPVARSVEVDGPSGSLIVPIDVDPAQRYEIHASIAGEPTERVAGGETEGPEPPLTSDATTASLPADGRRTRRID